MYEIKSEGVVSAYRIQFAKGMGHVSSVTKEQKIAELVHCKWRITDVAKEV